MDKEHLIDDLNRVSLAIIPTLSSLGVKFISQFDPQRLGDHF